MKYKKLFALLFVVFMLPALFLTQAYADSSAVDNPDEVSVNFIAYTSKNTIVLEDDDADYGAEVDSVTRLDNGVYKLVGGFGDAKDWGRYREGETLTYRFYGFNVARGTVKVEGNEFVCDLILMETGGPVKVNYDVEFVEGGVPVALTSSNVALKGALGDRATVFPLKAHAPKIKYGLPVDDQGSTIESPFSLDRSVGDLISLDGVNDYEILGWTKEGSTIKVDVVKRVSTNVPLTISVVLDTTMRITTDEEGTPVTTSAYSFTVNGKNVSAKPSSHAEVDGKIVLTFDLGVVKLTDAQTEADIKVSLNDLPRPMKTMGLSIPDQSFNAAEKKLSVTIGRDVLINVSKIKNGTSYMDMGPEHNNTDFVLTLYDTDGHELQDSVIIRGQIMTTSGFRGLVPGDYVVKIKSHTPAYDSYDTSQSYALKIDAAGYPQLEILTTAGKKLSFANGQLSGGDHPMKMGYKSPFFLFLSPNAPATKSIEDTNISASQTMVQEGDEVTFKIQKTLPGDHNVILKFRNFYDNGTSSPQGFEDILDENLKFVPDSLSVMIDGAPTTEFTARWDEDAHKVVVEDHSTPAVVNIDFDHPVVLPQDKTLTVTFKAEVLSAEREIENTVGNTVELIPYTSLKVKKVWTGGEHLLENFDFDAFLASLKVKGYVGDTLVSTNDVSDFMVADKTVRDGANFTLTLERMPKYTNAELAKSKDQRIAIDYRIEETLTGAYEDFTGFNTVENDTVVVHNVYIQPLTSVKVTKQWANMKPGMDAQEFTPKFKLVMTQGDTTQEFFFDKTSAHLTDVDGNEFTFIRKTVENGGVVDTPITPAVAFNNDVYTISNLPEGDAQGNMYTFSVEEVSISHNGEDVSADFDVVVSPMEFDLAEGIYSTEVVNTHNVDYIDINVSKVWDTTKNKDAQIPETIEVKLVVNGNETDQVLTLRADEGWSGKFTNLPTSKNGIPLAYTIKEVNVEGFTSAFKGTQNVGFTLINTADEPPLVPTEFVGFKLTKNWENLPTSKPSDEFTPKFKLVMKSGDATQELFFDKTSTDLVDGAGAQFTFTANVEKAGVVVEDTIVPQVTFADGIYTLSSLPKVNDEGVAYEYTVEEIAVLKDGMDLKADFTVTAMEAVFDDAAGLFTQTITNSYIEKLTRIDVVKTWDLTPNPEVKLPDSIVVVLVADGVDTDKTLTLTKAGEWKGAFENLPLEKDGVEIAYSIKEIKVEGFISTTGGTAKDGFTIVNKAIEPPVPEPPDPNVPEPPVPDPPDPDVPEPPKPPVPKPPVPKPPVPEPPKPPVPEPPKPPVPEPPKPPQPPQPEVPSVPKTSDLGGGALTVGAIGIMLVGVASFKRRV